MKTAKYKLLNIKVKIIEEKGDLYTIVPLQSGVHWYEAKVNKSKLKDIQNENIL